MEAQTLWYEGTNILIQTFENITAEIRISRRIGWEMGERRKK
jgi:hypothetical protein